MYYTYVLLGTEDRRLYTGFTQHLTKRLELHRRGFMLTNRKHGPLKLIYLEACLNKEDASRRHKYLDSLLGRRYLKNRLKKYFDSA